MRPYNRYTYTEEIGKLHGANENSPRRAEIKVRKNEMKLRKKGIKVRKNFFVPHWIVLFLKKVHSWEGITETVHGLFLLVL